MTNKNDMLVAARPASRDFAPSMTDNSTPSAGDIAPTPTLCAQPRRFSDFATLGEALDYAAQRHARHSISTTRAARWCAPIPMPSCARTRSAPPTGCIARGVKPGDRIALIAETGPEFAALFFGAIYAGAWPVPLPLPTSFGGTRSLYRPARRAADQLRSARCCSIPPELAAMASEAADAPGVERAMDWESFAAPATRPRRAARSARRDDIAYLQYSSGSTRFPHGVAVTHRALLNNLAAHADGMELRTGDRCISLAALVSRHGPGRLHAVAGRQPGVGRLSEDRGFRPPPARLARPDQPQPGHDAQLFADLRLRHLRAPRIEPDRTSPTASTCRAGGSPATAPT